MANKKNGPWAVHNRKTAFQNPWLHVETSDVTHPDGSAGTYGVVRFTNIACGVFPIDAEGHTWLVGQHRFPFDDYSWELPEGGGAMDVSAQDSAARELEEETGFKADRFALLGKWHLSNSVTDEVAYGYLAWGLSQGQPKSDPSEELELRRVPVSEVARMVREGEITDAFTHLMMMSALDMARQGKVPDEIAKFLLED